MCDEDWCAELERWLNEEYIPWFTAHSGGDGPQTQSGGGPTFPPTPPKKN